MGIARLAAKQYLFTVLAYPLTLVSFLVSTRFLEPEGRGLMAAVFLIPNTVLIGADLGVSVAVMWALGRGKLKEQEVIPALLYGGMLVGLLVAVCTGGALLLWPDELLDSHVTPLMVVLVALQMPFVVVCKYLAQMLMWRRWITRSFVVSTANKIAVILLTVSVALGLAAVAAPEAVAAGDLVVWLVGALTALQIATCGAYLWLLRDGISGGLGVRRALAAFWMLVRFGWPQTLTLGAMFLLHYGDQYYLLRLADDPRVTVGIYTAAVSLLQIVQSVPQAIGAVFFRPSMEAEFEDSARMVAIVARRTAMLTIAAAAGMWLLAPLVVRVLAGEKFAAAADALRILLIAAPMYAMGDMASTSAVHKGRVMATAVPVVIVVALNVWLNILWIPEHGMMGASWATVIAFAALCAMHLAVFAWYAGPAMLVEMLTPRMEDFRFFREKTVAGWRLLRGRGEEAGP